MMIAALSRLSTLLATLVVSLILFGCSARRGEPIAGPLPALSAEAERGRVAFMMHCHHCHPGGDSGLGLAINNKPLPSFLIRFQVRWGIGTMPAIPADDLPDEQLTEVIHYLKFLRSQPTRG